VRRRRPIRLERTDGSASYLLPFEIVSVHLLVVLIGAAYLARAKRRRGGAT
jgi:NADH:ubiquinone oxidoreductase subunit 6 (chain J)